MCGGNVRGREVALKEKLLELSGGCPGGLVGKDGIVELNGIIGLAQHEHSSGSGK